MNIFAMRIEIRNIPNPMICESALPNLAFPVQFHS
jgi:hypothetical protein